jgi:hypothetical protein
MYYSHEKRSMYTRHLTLPSHILIALMVCCDDCMHVLANRKDVPFFDKLHETYSCEKVLGTSYYNFATRQKTEDQVINSFTILCSYTKHMHMYVYVDM